ncbi:MAG: hypothetical protein PQJ60_07515 [Spirochaetales bacterium]|nr:hypothetical protein [Spirochaetales bacterium]
MASDDKSQELDPDIASLLDNSLTPSPAVPDFKALMSGKVNKGQTPLENGSPDVNILKESFDEIEVFEQPPQKYFYNPNYYKIALAGEGEAAEELHKNIAAYLKAPDPQTKTTYRLRLITNYWEYLRSLAKKVGPEMKLPKKLTLRYGALIPTTTSPEQRDMLSRIIFNSKLDEPIHYQDEWLMKVGMGEINPLATDEIQLSQQSSTQKLKNQLEKAKGSHSTNVMFIQKLQTQRKQKEQSLEGRMSQLFEHRTHSIFTELETPYTEVQKNNLNQLMDILRDLSKLDREISQNYNKLNESSKDLDILKRKIDEMGGSTQLDTNALAAEVDSLRQAHKLCVGRQGNHFPFLMKNYFYSSLSFVGTKENVLTIMGEVEKIDPGIFRRVFRQQSNRIVPHTIILPCYGERGICWEPFEKFNRSSSRGRIIVPMFPKDLKIAVIYALAALRWEVAKEKSSHYWMEEGLTGYYYQWFTGNKLRGDVKVRFQDDYYLWITKESEAMQKLNREVREIFWRYIPFPQEIKNNLKNRGFVYSELNKKDLNRAMSDGY